MRVASEDASETRKCPWLRRTPPKLQNLEILTMQVQVPNEGEGQCICPSVRPCICPHVRPCICPYVRPYMSAYMSSNMRQVQVANGGQEQLEGEYGFDYVDTGVCVAREGGEGGGEAGERGREYGLD